MKICICDDDKIIHQEIKDYLAPFFTEANAPSITDCFSGEELVSHGSTPNFFDIIFLDIEMGKINGIDAAAEIRKYSPETIIIFVSSHRNYVFDAFKCEALHYIVKPIKQAEFQDVFNRALHKYRVLNNCFPIKWNHTRSNIRISDIMYVEGFKRRLLVHTENETFNHIGKISDAYEQLKAHGFVLIHQGYVVNMHYIQTFLSDEVVLLNGEKVMVSVRKRAEALQIYDKYIQKWKW